MLRVTPIPRALSRHNLVLGGEREPVLLLLLICAILAVAGQTLPTVILGAVLLVAGLSALRWMAAADPQMTDVYRRHILYRDRYPARSTPWGIG